MPGTFKFDPIPPIIRNTVIGLLGAWSFIVFFPGSYSIDSWNMFNQVLSGHYTDWHSPVMVFVWKVLYRLTDSYYAIYVLQMLLYWWFIHLLLNRANRTWPGFMAGCLIAGLLLFIPQYVMKDTGHCIVWGIAALLLIDRSAKDMKFSEMVRIALLLAYGFYARTNTIIGLLPLLYVFVGFYLLRSASLFKTWGLVVSLILVLVISNYIINYKLLHAERTYPQYKLQLLDVIGISKATGQNYIPGYISENQHFDRAKLFRDYTPASIDDIYWPPNGSPSMIPYPNAGLNDCVQSSWFKAVSGHPFIYLQNRFTGFMYYLRIKKRFADHDYWNVGIWTDPNNPVHLTQKQNVYIAWFQGMYYNLAGTLFFASWLWLLLNMVLCAFYYWRFRKNALRVDLVQACVQLSGIMYLLSQFFVYQHDRDFRYTYWNLVVFAIGSISLFEKRAEMWGLSPQSVAGQPEIAEVY